ncbi:putative toxin-antitoxin system toxin component, PIN family [Dehalococcoidia bacterium]|nr:putative toxin-antitoxin system toxin component, PIN family [Dehalococcoidia bacterium]
MRIVLDTNVLAAGFLKPYEKPAAVLRLIVNGILQVSYDSRILSEYREVLLREKFCFTIEQVDAFLEQVEAEGFLATARPLKVHLADPDDEPFIEVALASRADALITGNKRHYPRHASEGIAILNPAEFLECYRIKPKPFV